MEDQFMEKAGSWDIQTWNQEMIKAAHQAIINKKLIKPDTHLLDFAAGTGMLSMSFAHEVEKITAVDSSKSMLDEFRKKVDQAQLKHIEIIEGILETGLIKDECKDLIISSMALHHIEDLDPLFMTFFEILKNGGHVALIDLAKEQGDFHPEEAQYYHNGFSNSELEIPLRRAGFSNISFTTVASLPKESKFGEVKNYDVLMVTATK